MSTYTCTVRTQQSQWIARDGVIGTAHRNRDGEWVDFRPAQWWDHGYFLDRGWTIKFTPAKGVKAERLSIEYSTIEAVEYSMDRGLVRATLTLSAPQTTALAAGDPPAQWQIQKYGEVSGWPLPAEIAELIVAERKAGSDSLARRLEAERHASDLVMAWLEGQPANSMIRRWTQRWINDPHKAYEQLFSAAVTQFPLCTPAALERALRAFRDGVLRQHADAD